MIFVLWFRLISLQRRDSKQCSKTSHSALRLKFFHFPVSKSIACRTFYFLVKGHSPFIVVSYHLNLMILWPLTLFCCSRCIGWPPTPRLLESSRSSWGPPSRWMALIDHRRIFLINLIFFQEIDSVAQIAQPEVEVLVDVAHNSQVIMFRG